MDDNSCSSNDTKRKMMDEIKALNFAVIELNLYLDTHPEDKRALSTHNEYVKMLNELKDRYQQAYEPLSIYYPYNECGWQSSPWPWERRSF